VFEQNERSDLRTQFKPESTPDQNSVSTFPGRPPELNNKCGALRLPLKPRFAASDALCLWKA